MHLSVGFVRGAHVLTWTHFETVCFSFSTSFLLWENFRNLELLTFRLHGDASLSLKWVNITNDSLRNLCVGLWFNLSFPLSFPLPNHVLVKILIGIWWHFSCVPKTLTFGVPFLLCVLGTRSKNKVSETLGHYIRLPHLPKQMEAAEHQYRSDKNIGTRLLQMFNVARGDTGMVLIWGSQLRFLNVISGDVIHFQL